MELLRIYDIDISKLNLGQHDFHFQIEDKFFELFDYSLIDHGSLSASIILDKKTSFLSMEFKIKGRIELICDRSLDSFDFDLETENEIVLKYGEEARVLSDEIEMIPLNIQKINVARYMYEFISVAMPMKKLHPRYKNESSEDQIIFSSTKDQEEMLDVDPRWNELKKLKNKE